MYSAREGVHQMQLAAKRSLNLRMRSVPASAPTGMQATPRRVRLSTRGTPAPNMLKPKPWMVRILRISSLFPWVTMKRPREVPRGMISRSSAVKK